MKTKQKNKSLSPQTRCWWFQKEDKKKIEKSASFAYTWRRRAGSWTLSAGHPRAVEGVFRAPFERSRVSFESRFSAIENAPSADSRPDGHPASASQRPGSPKVSGPVVPFPLGRSLSLAPENEVSCRLVQRLLMTRTPDSEEAQHCDAPATSFQTLRSSGPKSVS